jgi:sucrose phosphorylase
VVRPRSHPLLNPVETAAGVRNVWCTFSHDQVDVDFSNPELLVEYIRILRFLIDKGLRIVRLDAVAFIWKVPGTNCIHLPETHEIVRLMRTLCDHCEHEITLITETNVPNHENLTYFGNRNEAHAIYNFSLPPLLVHALLSGSCEALNKWLMTMPQAQLGCAYLNFTASHDGIGLRPLEGLLSEEEKLAMIEAITGFGGLLSMRKAADGSDHPYEMNIALFDAMRGTLDGPDDHQVARFRVFANRDDVIAGHSCVLHPLAACHPQRSARRGTHQPQPHHQPLTTRLWRTRSSARRRNIDRHQVFNRLKQLIALRSRQPAFHPNALQSVMQLGAGVFGVERVSLDQTQTILAIANLQPRNAVLNTVSLDLAPGTIWCDLISGEACSSTPCELELAPYQCVWLSNTGG